MICLKFLLILIQQRESLVFSNLNRLFIGSILVLVVLLFYINNFDLLFIFILLSFISYDLFHIKVTSNYFLIFSIASSILAMSFISFQLFENLFIFESIIVLCIFFLNKYKRELFVLSLYIFCIILFYIINIDRNIFYELY